MEPLDPGTVPTRGDSEVPARLVPAMEPLDVDGTRTIAVLTVLWLAAGLGLLTVRGALDEDGRTWWLWTCVAGIGLGLVGLADCARRRRRRRSRDA